MRTYVRYLRGQAPDHARPASADLAVGLLHERGGADQEEAGDRADEGEDRGDQDDLVEGADEGDVGGLDGFRADRRWQVKRFHPARPAGRDDFAEALGG